MSASFSVFHGALSCALPEYLFRFLAAAAHVLEGGDDLGDGLEVAVVPRVGGAKGDNVIAGNEALCVCCVSQRKDWAARRTRQRGEERWQGEEKEGRKKETPKKGQAPCTRLLSFL